MKYEISQCLLSSSFFRIYIGVSIKIIYFDQKFESSQFWYCFSAIKTLPIYYYFIIIYNTILADRHYASCVRGTSTWAFGWYVAIFQFQLTIRRLKCCHKHSQTLKNGQNCQHLDGLWQPFQASYKLTLEYSYISFESSWWIHMMDRVCLEVSHDKNRENQLLIKIYYFYANSSINSEKLDDHRH